MKVIVIPDVHLKPHIFEKASKYIAEGKVDRAVCLMNIADDFKQEFNLDLYKKTYDAAIRFAKAHQDTLWCWGNHDMSYIWERLETGFSPYAIDIVRTKKAD
jgi:Icc-related predicted phosphoesterase